MLLEAVEAAGIHSVKEDDFYLTLVQGNHVRVALLSVDVPYVDVFYRKNRSSGSPPETQAGAQYPLSRTRHQPRGLRSRYEIDGTWYIHHINVFRIAVLPRAARVSEYPSSTQTGDSVLLPSATGQFARPGRDCRER